ncbi:hypothetical protein C0995_000632, partial [Termitomyces sp. Mi166
MVTAVERMNEGFAAREEDLAEEADCVAAVAAGSELRADPVVAAKAGSEFKMDLVPDMLAEADG